MLYNMPPFTKPQKFAYSLKRDLTEYIFKDRVVNLAVKYRSV